MDVHMPDMDGWTATGLIRRAEAGPRHTPIIALTADAAETNRRRCQEAGMDGFLAKPLALEDLFAALAQWLPRATERPPAETAALSVKTVSRISELDRKGTGGFLKRVTTIFVESSNRQIDAILAGVANGDLAVVRAHSHSLKSASSHVGADHLAQLLVEVERAAHASDATRVAILATGLRTARAAAVDALQAELAKRSA
jgi:response regulator RpfG family c-di-GMP phosphodiesterase